MIQCIDSRVKRACFWYNSSMIKVHLDTDIGGGKITRVVTKVENERFNEFWLKTVTSS